jgi:catechol 2,3-dioxygenase-like lactoylglutathione lyase family enzyme
MGVEGAKARARRLRPGDQMIEFLSFARPGLPYPADSASDDPWFQHIAIVVSDMEAAYARLSGCDRWTPITRPAPQKLPASSGGVTAFKFRDPEGHPLELLAFPPEGFPPYWQEAARRRGPCLGIDHSAIVVASTARSVEFYEQVLGFSVGARSLNRGKEQDQLDAVSGAVVEVTALAPGSTEPPHLELLCYVSAASRPATAGLCSNDVAATRLVLEMNDRLDIEQKLTAARAHFISSGIVTLENDRRATLISDPDGHALLLLGC